MSTTRADERTPLLDDDGGGGGGGRSNGEPSQETTLSTLPSPSASKSTTRQVAPDLLRGVLMILMALDHTSVSLGAYPHGTGTHSEEASVPVTQWSAPLPFAMRSSTHMVAPGFSLLMGMGIAYFIESRSRQGWTVTRQLRHIAVRTLAILLVNYASVGVSMATWTGKFLVVPNIILVALALDYLFVGVLYVLHVAYVEPWLKRTFSRRQGRCEADEDDESAVASLGEGSSSTLVTVAVDAFLVLLAGVTLSANILTSAHHGVCPATQGHAHDHISAATSDAPTIWLLAGGHTFQAAAAASSSRPSSPPEVCQHPGKLLYNFLFQQVTCLDQGILSGFPPVGWLSFVIFGVAYGRWLLASRKRNISAQSINASLAVVFALLFVSTRLGQWGNTSTHCLSTPDQLAQKAGSNPYLASWRSFAYIVKYPPDAAFAFATLAGNFILLALFDVALSTGPSLIKKSLQNPSNILLAYGVQPLFFYGAHFWVLMTVQAILLYSGLAKRNAEGRPEVGLGWVFLAGYATVLGVMWPLCVAFGRFKRRQGGDSVWKFL
ncbi:hypothetical protein BDZ90DRAFT_229987 [Jaminaea rosea]|uniref:Heparan-alpha-glucosaminide N-acetyltransferase catalytic domain-containing protein n=1 Tax=Jaminaea rosea TaxID=1569628 RepID=A0A316V379_9BASI|nr:hypothetical protein BDZ90DRAFT_229987 [Jaminaea rosea]PWN30991.1 hypothetical protein BDZ90DRAFT_229987 [Jaminaea rosea]